MKAAGLLLLICMGACSSSQRSLLDCQMSHLYKIPRTVPAHFVHYTDPWTGETREYILREYVEYRWVCMQENPR